MAGTFAEKVPATFPFEPVVFVTAPAVLAMAALFATWLPARRATRGIIGPGVTSRSRGPNPLISNGSGDFAGGWHPYRKGASHPSHG